MIKGLNLRNLLILIAITLYVSLVLNFLSKSKNICTNELAVKYVDITDTDSIKHIVGSEVYPVIYKNIPNLSELDKDEKKRIFLDIMIPSILMAEEKIKLKQDSVIKIKQKAFEGDLNHQDSIFLKRITKEYRTDSLQYIIESLHSHPLSITLAQAAVESGWGTSRFCQEANNVFGIWSYNRSEKRVRANNARDGKAVYLRKYDSVFESVYNYLETISRVHSYNQFRKARSKSDNPYQLIWHLSNYSERRYEYVKSLRDIIEHNQLNRYDSVELMPFKSDGIFID
ncbi:glucosaminidase domain-containing protein [Saccharicrinis aurantiacus]|uniref:glucosaminidase domain-containing protein n=1 Tax=Saccharicrinis aurantiacus TaxID=1849719 RepID=UPI002492BA8E|nr:glucosaminidase domain-containing protein [Saccharicrinis aurantiacus]